MFEMMLAIFAIKRNNSMRDALAQACDDTEDSNTFVSTGDGCVILENQVGQLALRHVEEEEEEEQQQQQKS